MTALRFNLDAGHIGPGGMEQIIELGEDAPPIQISGIRNGLASGAPAVSIRFDLPDGRIVVANTSLKLLLTAADALKAYYGDPR